MAMAIDEAALAAELQQRHGVTTRARLRRLGRSYLGSDAKNPC